MRKFYLLFLTLICSVGTWAQVITGVGTQITDLSHFTRGTGHGDHYLVEVVKNMKSDGAELTNTFLYSDDGNSRIKAQTLTLDNASNYQHIFNIFKTSDDGKFKIYVNDKGITSFASTASGGFNISKSTAAAEYTILAVDGETGVFQLRGFASDRAYLKVNSSNKEVYVAANADGAMLVKIYKANIKSSAFTFDPLKDYCLRETTTGLFVKNTATNVTLTNNISTLKPFKITDKGNGTYTFQNTDDNKFLNAGWTNTEMQDGECVWSIEKVNGEEFALHFMGNGNTLYQTGFIGTNVVSNGQQLYSNQTVNDGKVLKFQLIDLANVVDLVYSYQVDGNEKLTENLKAITGFPYPAPFQIPAFVDYTLPTENVKAEDDGQKIPVVCTYSLPFTVSNSYNDAVWYMIDMHSNQGNYIWTYDPSKDINVSLPEDPQKQSTLPANSKLWCFVGDAFEGFEIYNKEAGSGMKLYRQNDSDGTTGKAVMSDTQYSKFQLAKSSTITGAICFRPVGQSNYLNKQASNGYNFLSGWSATDEGSSCRLFAPTHFVKEALAPYATTPVGAIGTPENLSTHKNTVTEAYADIQADGWNTEAVTTDVTNAINALDGATKIAFTPGYYRIYNALPGLYSRDKGVYLNSSNSFVWGTVEKSAMNAIMYLETSTSDESKVVMKNANTGRYMQGVAGASGTTIGTNSHITLTSLGYGQYNLVFGNGTMHANGHNNGEGNGSTLLSWSGGFNSASAWYIIPATELDITIGATGYASTFLPFDVTIPSTSDLKAYAVTVADATSATLTEKGDIPANQGAILKGTENTPYKLNIATATSNWGDNKLSGSCTDTYIDADAYVLAKPTDGTVGLYKAVRNTGANGTGTGTYFKNNANKAYLPASALSGGAGNARFLVFDFGTETGIEAVEEAAQSNAAIYDLSGRRVQKTQKGLYVVNGKVVIK